MYFYFRFKYIFFLHKMRLFKINYNISFTLLLHVDNCLYKLLIYIQLQMRVFEKKKKRVSILQSMP